MNSRILLLLCLVITMAGGLKAQDPAFAQFYANRLYLNPAFTGTQSGLTLGAHYKNQWSYVPGGFTTYSAWVDIQEPFLSSGFGMLLIRDQEGSGHIVSQGLGLSYAYILPFSKNFNVNIGVRTAYWEKQIDWSRLVFSDQLHPVDGIMYGTNAQPVPEKARFLDFDAGIVARWGMTIGKKDIDSNVGIAISHLSEPDESLQNIGTKLPRRYTIHLGTMIPIMYFRKLNRRQIYISPNVKMDMQGDIQVFSYGFYALSSPIYVGVFYQNRTPTIDLVNTNAVVVMVGMEANLSKHTSVNIGYSYDANLTGLGTKVRGAHEISMRINFEDASMFGISGARTGYNGKRARRLKSRNKTSCYRFKGRSSVRIY